MVAYKIKLTVLVHSETANDLIYNMNSCETAILKHLSVLIVTSNL